MRRFRKTMLQSNVVLASATLFSTVLIFHAVQADDKFNKRFYITGGVGASQLEPESPSSALSISDKSDGGGHLGIGFDVTRFLTVEAYAASLGSAEVQFQGRDAGSVDYTVYGLSALGYLFNSRSGVVMGDDDMDGLYRREGASLYARLGLGHMQNDSDRVNYRRDYPNHVAVGLGVEYGFSNGVALRTELMSMDTDAQYVNVGIVKRFGKSAAIPAAAAALPVSAEPQVVRPAPVAVAPPSEPKMFKAVQSPYIYFDFDGSVLSPESSQKLDDFAELLKDNDLELIVEGHTDWLAPEAYNMSLSVRRAEAVANHLVSRGIARERLSTVGYGETRPISDNDTEEGRALNRRSEVILR